MDNSWLAFALITLAICAVMVYQFFMLHKLQSQLTALQQQQHQQSQQTQRNLLEWQNQLDEAGARTILIGKQQSQLAQQLQKLEQQLLDVQQQDPVVRLYHRATELAKQGATVEDIVQGCDISHAEALLLVNLHQKHLDV